MVPGRASSSSDSPSGGAWRSNQALMAASYPAVWAKARRASSSLVDRESPPDRRSSSTTGP